MRTTFEARTSLASEALSARAARRFIDTTLQLWECASLVEPVALLANELVTNAILHARSDVALTVRLSPSRLRVEVADESEEQPQLRSATVEATSGRGLAVVESIASAWGVEHRLGEGKVVWFEVPVDGG